MQSFRPRGFHQCLQMSYLDDLTQTLCLLVRTWDLLSGIAVEQEDGLKNASNYVYLHMHVHACLCVSGASLRVGEQVGTEVRWATILSRAIRFA